MIHCAIKNGRAYLSNLGNREAQTINDLMTFEVPGHEHMPLFKQGKWDGRKSYFEWRSKSFKKGLLDYIRRKSGFIFQVAESDCNTTPLPFYPVKIYKDGQVYDMRDFQLNCVRLLEENYGGLAQIATNGGKTACISSIVKAVRMMRRRAIILENRVDLLDQIKAEVEASIEARIGSVTAKVKDIKDISILMVPTAAQAMKRVREGTGSAQDEDFVEYLRSVDVVLVDECFPKGTMVDGRDISDVTLGDAVRSYNHATGKIEFKKVIAVFKRSKPVALCKVTLSNGATIVCTPGHPFYIKDKACYLAACKLCSGMVLSTIKELNNESTKNCSATLSGMQKAGIVLREAWQSGSTARPGVLFRKMREKFSSELELNNNVKDKQTVRLREDDKKKSYEEGECPCESINKVAGSGLVSKSSRWEWLQSYYASKIISLCSWLGYGIINYYKSKKARLSYLLQGRYWKQGFESGNRGGRKIAQSFGEKESGREKGFISEIVRVESVTFQEHTSDGTFGGLCADGYVYNIEVQDNNNYFVNDVLVHNCHHATAPSYVDILSMNPAAQRYGFSGTVPGEDELAGLELMELFGDVLIRVPNSELIARGISARPTIHLIEYDIPGLEGKADLFGSQIKNTCFKKQFSGTDSSGTAIIKHVFSVPTYTAKIKEYVMNYSVKHCQEFWDILKKLTTKHTKVPTVILVDWVDFSEKLAEWLDATVMHGKTKGRKQIIEDFKAGKINRVVATSILDEGLSIDQIRVIILATVGKSERQFLQRIGRGLRKKDEDNTLAVYDFVRHGHDYLLGPSKERIQMWKEEGFGVKFLDVEDI